MGQYMHVVITFAVQNVEFRAFDVCKHHLPLKAISYVIKSCVSEFFALWPSHARYSRWLTFHYLVVATVDMLLLFRRPGMGACEILRWVYVSLSVCPLAYLKTCPNSTKFSVHATCSVLLWRQCSSYVLPVLWMTSSLFIIGEAKATPIEPILKVTHQGEALGAKSWRLQLPCWCCCCCC